MTKTYQYLATFDHGGGSRTRLFFTKDHAVTAEELISLEEQLEKKYKKTTFITFLKLLYVIDGDENNSKEQDEFAKYLVRNLDTGKTLEYSFRSEALAFYEQLVKESGVGHEIELVLRIKHHIPPELPTQ